MSRYFRVLTIAGSDSGGGAGIQADLKTFAANGCYGLSVITALTAQNTCTVSAIHPVPTDFIAAQLDAVLTDIGVDAVKIGMLHAPGVIQVVADRLQHYQVPNIVVDPVMVAKSGDVLLQDEAVAALRSTLLPLATVITPNIPEAAVLLERPESALLTATGEFLDEPGEALLALGPGAVLLKGGHLSASESPDRLYLPGGEPPHRLPAQRVATRNTHGTGCTLSAAIAAHLARGFALPEAVAGAKDYITRALQAGAAYQLGSGHGPVHHFHAVWH